MRRGWRLAGLGGLFLAMFVVLFLRLWFVQVAAGEEYAVRANDLTVASSPTLAPRGQIRDRDGTLLATSRFAPAVIVDRNQIPSGQEDHLKQRLSSLLGMSPLEIESAFDAPTTRVKIKEIDAETAYFVLEHQRDYPGVFIELVPIRVYPEGAVASHVIGHIGRPDQADLDERPDLDPNATIGKAGVERSYDDLLQGNPGVVAYRVNARGEILDELREIPATQGDTLWLTIDLETQQVVEQALERVISLANEEKRAADEYHNLAKRATAVVLDVDDGSVVAMASYPDFDPGEFVGGLSRSQFSALNEQAAFTNLAIQGDFPPASTFKAVTYVTAMEENLFPRDATADTPDGRVHCDGSLEFGFDDGSRQVYPDWYYPDELGWLNIHEAFEQSCNIYFYGVALRIWQDFNLSRQEDILQEWARQLGYGELLGIDLPFEHTGTVPDRELFDELAKRGVVREEGWQGGDLMNVAIGQGNVLATPLQVAASYAAIANGGTLWKPRVVQEVRDRLGQVVATNLPEAIREIDLSASTVAAFRRDLHRVTAQGTAAVAFSDFGEGWGEVGGKTGTAQNGANRDNTAWFAGVAPVSDPRYAVVVVVEEGGSGGRIAAPAGRYILQYLMGGKPTGLVAGARTD